jgi:hypothetical protein
LGLRGGAVTDNWRKLHNEELCDFCTSQNTDRNKIQEDEMGRACGMHRGKQYACRDSVEKLNKRDHLEYEEHTKLGRKEIEWEGVVKVKFTLEQAMKAHRGNSGIALLFL